MTSVIAALTDWLSGCVDRGSVRRAAGLLLVLVIVGAVLLWSRLAARTAAGDKNGAGPLDGRSAVLNRPAPNFSLRDPSGRLVRLSDLRGQVVLVNFWATWCQPCREELPQIAQIYREQRDQGVRVLEVDEQESSGDVLSYASQISDMPPVLLDSNGSVFLRQYARPGLPDSFFIDRQGIVRAASYGPMTHEAILKGIETARRTSS